MSKSDAPDLKRTRLVKAESTNDTIEDRVLSGTYDSIRALKEDVKIAQAAILTDVSTATQNGSNTSDVEDQLSKLVHVLDEYDVESKMISQITTDTDPVREKPKQFLSLRSQVNGGAQVLFSGLPLAEQPENSESSVFPEHSSSSLPNGFELTDFSALGGKAEAPKALEKRSFEKVFGQVRRIKPLDLPRQSKDVVRGNTLDFIPNSSRSDNLPFNKQDYKFAKLPTGSWLSYRPSQQGRKKAQQSSSNSDFKAALAANNVRQGTDMDEAELFSSAYSSFAPSSDSAYSIVSEDDQSRRWWCQYGEQRLDRLFRPLDKEIPEMNGEPADNDEFADVVANFEPEEEQNVKPDSAEEETADLLNQISEMIETLSSYQRNRSLDHVVQGKVQKPSSSEVDMFEMLRTQLSILVDSLPPFAVAKLNGDQLQALNISTKILVETPDYAGTGKPDDYILKRQKMAQQATQAASRPSATPQTVRPNYSSVQPNTMGYGSQVRGYNASVPATSAYGMRTTQNYQTPSATRQAYSQASFQASSGTPGYTANRPTIQQFQRPSMQNGYNSYGSNTPLQPQQQQSQSQTSAGFAQRPSQPGYQQRAQDSAAVLARSASPQKPQTMVNGTQQHYTPRQYQPQQGQTSQTPFPFQRQSSGTPGTPIAPAAATMPARYDGAADQPGSNAQAGSGASQAARNAATQNTPQSNQTVEVSR